MMWRKQNDSQPSAGGISERTPAFTPAISESLSRSPERVAPVSSPGSTPHAAAADSRVARGMKLKGEVSSEANLHVEGVIEGSVHITGADLTIGPGGLLEGDAESRDIHILGKVRGNLNARGCVRLGPSSEVMGDVTAPRLFIEDGAQFNGRVEMRPQEAARSGIAAGNGSHRSGTVSHFVREGI
jgi:cytoskeletal protein CcmA (bactofilin family)